MIDHQMTPTPHPLPAGPALDAAVARALGHEVHWVDLWCEYAADYSPVLCELPPGAEGDDEAWPLRKYSTDIAAAWLVVEALRERGWLVALDVCPQGVKCWVSHTTEFPGGGYRKDGHGTFADTAPLAICRAAVRALAPELHDQHKETPQ